MGMGRCHEKKLNGKIKRKRKKQRNEMAISKDNKKLILLLLKLKCNKIIFIGDLEHSNPLLSSKQNMRIIKWKKVKYEAYQGGHLTFLAFLLVFMQAFSSLKIHFMSSSNHCLYPAVGQMYREGAMPLVTLWHGQASRSLPKILLVNTSVRKAPSPLGAPWRSPNCHEIRQVE